MRARARQRSHYGRSWEIVRNAEDVRAVRRRGPPDFLSGSSDPLRRQERFDKHRWPHVSSGFRHGQSSRLGGSKRGPHQDPGKKVASKKNQTGAHAEPTVISLSERIELRLHLPGQAGAHQSIGCSQAVAKLVLCCIPGQVYPRAMEVCCPHGNSSIDQHLRRFNAVGLDRHARRNSPDAGEHLSAYLPRVVSTAPRIRDLGIRKCSADGINDPATHARPHESFCLQSSLGHFAMIDAHPSTAVTNRSLVPQTDFAKRTGTRAQGICEV
jgi:hypothetical protein